MRVWKKQVHTWLELTVRSASGECPPDWFWWCSRSLWRVAPARLCRLAPGALPAGLESWKWPNYSIDWNTATVNEQRHCRDLKKRHPLLPQVEVIFVFGRSKVKVWSEIQNVAKTESLVSWPILNISRFFLNSNLFKNCFAKSQTDRQTDRHQLSRNLHGDGNESLNLLCFIYQLICFQQILLVRARRVTSSLPAVQQVTLPWS